MSFQIAYQVLITITLDRPVYLVYYSDNRVLICVKQDPAQQEKGTK
jgi:hypothetical protein